MSTKQLQAATAYGELYAVSASKRRFSYVLSAIGLLLITMPIFFETYRAAVFNTAPRDDYAPYLLALIGKGGRLPGSPFVYRILSVAVAIPFYFVLPVYAFSNLKDIDLPYVRATQAISMASYLAMVISSLLMYRIARTRYGASTASSSVVLLLAVLFNYCIGMTGIATIVILTITILIYYEDNDAIFIPLILVSAIINEKIPIIFSTLMLTRAILLMWNSRKYMAFHDVHPRALASLLSLAAYFAIRAYFRIPGAEHQTDPFAFLPALVATITYTLSLKGLILNLTPLIMLAITVSLAFVASGHLAQPQKYLFRSSISVCIMLLVLCSIVDLQYTAGGTVLYSFPFYLPLIARYIDDEMEPAGASLRPHEENG